MEIPSGVRIKAMRPSRGGRLIVTPRAMKALQVDCGPVVPEGNRTGDKSETQMAPPDRPCGHQAALSGRQD